ncbi:transposase [Niallia circulans]|nr:transposase [Niallia circulans]
MGNHRADREELNRLIEEYKQIMADYMDSVFRANSVRIGAQELLAKRGFSPPHIAVVEEGDIYGDLQAIHRFWDGMVTADSTAKADFSAAQTGLSALDSALNAFTNGLGKNGAGLATLNVEQLKQAIFEDKNLITSLLIKMESGEALNYGERELLYQYIQSEVLDGDIRKDMQALTGMIGDGSDALLNRINHQVLASEDALDREIALVEAYLYRGNLSPDEHDVASKDAAKLRAYLEVLYNYKKAIIEVREETGEEIGGVGKPLFARVEDIEYEEIQKPYSLSFQTNIMIFMMKSEKTEWTREQFLEMESMPTVRINKSEVNYYMGGKGHLGFQLAENEELDQKKARYNAEFIGAEVGQLLLSELGNKIPGLESLERMSRHQAGQEDINHQLTIGEAKVTAGALKMELHVTRRPPLRLVGEREELNISFQPTNETFDIIERWKEVHAINAEIPYPQEAIDYHDWYTISDELLKAQAPINKINDDLYNYIIDGDLPEDRTTEELVGNHAKTRLPDETE